MEENHTIFVAAHPFDPLGNELLGDNWGDFCFALRKFLRQKGLECQESTDELYFFSYNHPITALRSIFESLEQLKNEFNWPETLGAAPVQFFIHFDNQNNFVQSFNKAVSNQWDILALEKVYATEALMLQWEQFMEGKRLPAHSFEKEGEGVYRLDIPDDSLYKPRKLFPYREMVRQGSEKECFYCGMKNHHPASCPSKLLTIEMQGLSEAGYIPIPELSEAFKNAFSCPDHILNLLTAGATISQIRKNPALQVFIAYFDIFKIYQLRFLWNISFANFAKWEELGKPEVLMVDSQSMHLGLDCLRVCQYEQAEEFFVDESRRPKGKAFYATIGRAFMALEMERYSDMGHFLQSAASMASSEKERIYISFLLSRFHEIEGDSWKAEQVVDNIFSIMRDCPEGLYRQIQLAVQKGYNEKALRQLNALVMESRQYFMAALIDPLLLNISGPVEDILHSLVQAKLQEAEEGMAQVRKEVQDLQNWFAEDDPQLQAHFADLADIEKQYDRQSYFDTLDIFKKSKRIIASCYHVQEVKLDELSVRIESAVRRWEGYRRYWKTYPYKRVFKDFHEFLSSIKEKISEARPMAEKNKGGEVYRTAADLLENAVGKLDSLKPMIVRMNGVKIIIDGVKLFFRKLIITEIALLVFLVVLMSVLIFCVSAESSGGFVGLIKEGWFQKQIIMVITLLVGPMVALAQTLWKLMET